MATIPRRYASRSTTIVVSDRECLGAAERGDASDRRDESGMIHSGHIDIAIQAN